MSLNGCFFLRPVVVFHIDELQSHSLSLLYQSIGQHRSNVLCGLSTGKEGGYNGFGGAQ